MATMQRMMVFDLMDIERAFGVFITDDDLSSRFASIFKERFMDILQRQKEHEMNVEGIETEFIVSKIKKSNGEIVFRNNPFGV
jgi:hypothetical protein